jgi:truncated hemoglobin YjbI
MKSAVDELEIAADLKNELWNYLVMAAHSMVNQPRDF